MRIAIALAIIMSIALVFADPIPKTAYKYRSFLLAEAKLRWGVHAPTAIFASQVHQESGWNIHAQSSAGARGMTQFMPSTEKYMMRRYAILHSLGGSHNPLWAIRAMVLYNRELFDGIEDADTECDRIAMMLSAYNGGPHWLARDRALAKQHGANPNSWFGHVERFSSRSKSTQMENRNYVRRVIYVWQPLYKKNGFGRSACMDEMDNVPTH